MLDEKGQLVWRILFGVVMASLLAGVLFLYVSKQKEFETGSEAQALANDLSKTAFSSLNQRQTYDLPKAVGGSEYRIEIENNAFIVEITSGDQKGKQYKSATDVNIDKKSIPDPDKTLYLQGTGETVTVTAAPAELPEENLTEPGFENAPPFYEFAKENTKTVTALISAYYKAKEKFPEKEIDIRKYSKTQKENILRAKITEKGEFLKTAEIEGKENHEKIGYIENSWTVKKITLSDNDSNSESFENCPSIKEANLTGWLYKPQNVANNLKRRTWRKKPENKTITITEKLSLEASAATTNVSTYPTWKTEITKEDKIYTLHFAAMPWKTTENTPGFVFESKPSLEVVR